MQVRISLWCVIAFAVAGCGSSEPAVVPSPPVESRPTVFDPLTSTIHRAQGAQQTLDEQAAEQRRRIEEAER